MSGCWGCARVMSLGNEMKASSITTNMVDFSPPVLSAYSINNADDEYGQRLSCFRKVVFFHQEYNQIIYPWIEVECFQLKKTSTKKSIIVLHIKNKYNVSDNKITIIHSHGNSCDLGIAYPFLVDLSTQLKADIISYDYTGYGRSEGIPSEKDMYTDIEEVMNFCLMHLLLKLDNLILLGISLGSVPTIHIASQRAYANIKGIVLLSPIGRGMKIVNPKMSTESRIVDIVRKASDIACPVFLIHGVKDDVAPQEVSQDLLTKMKYVYEWFPSLGNHTNITSKYRSKFYCKMKMFFEHLKLNDHKSTKTMMEIELTDQSNIDQTKISLHYNRRKLKAVKCEENCIFPKLEQRKQTARGCK